MKTGIIFSALAAFFAAGAVGALAISDDPARDKPSGTKSAMEAEAAAKAADEFIPPPGFVKKKRGNYVLYCKRDTTVGTRIKTENCYDEQQVRDYMLAMKETKDSVDRIRNSCVNICMCGSPEACNPNIREPR
jgi:hypothetical protein